MACLANYSLRGILADCNPSLAGISEIWIGYFGDYDVTLDESAEASARTVSAITKVDSAATMQHYTFAKQTGSLNSTLTKDEAAGTRYYTNTITLQFSKLEGWKHLEIEALAAEQLCAIVKDNNQKYWFVGFDGYLSTAEATANTGQSYDDANGYNLTMNAMSAYLPLEMTKEQKDSVTE